MTLDEVFNKYKGQSLLVPGDTEDDRGQCVQWADYVMREVYDLPYHYGNAIDWWGHPGELLANFDKITDGSIKKGDFVIFNTQVGSVFGHIDVAMQDGTTSNFQGADSNWGGDKTVHLVQHTNASYVIGSLRLKNQGDDMIDDAGARALLTISTLMAQNGAAPDRQPTMEEITNLIGKPYLQGISELMGTDPWKHNLAKVKYYDADVQTAHQAGVNKDSVQDYIKQHLQ